MREQAPNEHGRPLLRSVRPGRVVRLGAGQELPAVVGVQQGDNGLEMVSADETAAELGLHLQAKGRTRMAQCFAVARAVEGSVAANASRSSVAATRRRAAASAAFSVAEDFRWRTTWTLLLRFFATWRRLPPFVAAGLVKRPFAVRVVAATRVLPLIGAVFGRRAAFFTVADMSLLSAARTGQASWGAALTIYSSYSSSRQMR
jgi:hypothetical protein